MDLIGYLDIGDGPRLMHDPLALRHNGHRPKDIVQDPSVGSRPISEQRGAQMAAVMPIDEYQRLSLMRPESQYFKRA